MTEFRRLAESDRRQWAALRIALWPEEDPDELATELAGLLADETQDAFGAFESGDLIGFAECAERPWGEGCTTRPVGWLEGIYVVPERRREGLAALLVAAVEDWARARGLSELGSDAYVDNHVSIAAHGAWGFAETKRMVFFRRALR